MLRVAGLHAKGYQVYDFIVSAQRAGASARTFQLVLSELGPQFSMRRTDLLKDWKLVKESLHAWDNMKYVGYDKRFSEGTYKTTNYKLASKYMTTVEVSVMDRETGETFKRHLTMGHGERLTRGEVEGVAYGQLQETSPRWDIVYIRSVAAYRSL